VANDGYLWGAVAGDAESLFHNENLLGKPLHFYDAKVQTEASVEN
jgi:hypothetical protein